MPTLDLLAEGIPSGDVLIWAMLLPFVLGLFFAALALRLRGESTARSAAWGASVALLGGWIAIHLHIWGMPPLPPVMAFDWLIVCVPMAAAAALWNGAGTAKPKLGLAIQVVTAVAVAAIVLMPRVRVAGWDAAEMAGKIALYGGALVAAWLGATSAARRRPDREGVALLMVVAGCASTAIGMSGSQLLGQAAGGVAACLAGILIACARESSSSARLALGAAPVAAAATGALLLNGSLYAYLDLDVYLLMLASLALAPAGALLWPDRRGLLAGAIRVAILASPALGATGLAAMRFQPDDGSAGYN